MSVLDKDESILELPQRLSLEKRGWVVRDHWDGDTCAIGIASARDERRLVYISTFDKGPGRYDFECELPSGSQAEHYSVAGRGENVDFATLFDAPVAHLG